MMYQLITKLKLNLKWFYVKKRTLHVSEEKAMVYLLFSGAVELGVVFEDADSTLEENQVLYVSITSVREANRGGECLNLVWEAAILLLLWLISIKKSILW